MSQAVFALLAGMVLAVSLAGPPGPMNALIARESSRHGAWAGMRVGLGAPVADVVYLVLLLVGASALLESAGVVRTAAALGSLLMLKFCWGTLFDAPALDARDTKQAPSSFWSGFGAAMMNPYQLAWWFSAGYVFVQTEGTWAVVGFILGIFGWVVAFSLAMAHGARRWTWFTPAIKWASALLLGVFSVILALIALSIIDPTPGP